MYNTTQTYYNAKKKKKNEAQTCKTCRINIILTKPTKTLNQTQQNTTKQYSITIFPYRHIYTKSKKTRARNLKYFENKRKPIPFLEDWWRIDEENEGFVSENGGFGRGRGGQDKVCTWSEGKLKSFRKLSWI